MTKKQLEDMVNGVQKPVLKESEVKLLLNKEDANIIPIARPQTVAQPKPQQVAQVKLQVVAKEVAQVTWVAQEVAQKVVQPNTKSVAQDRPQVVAQPKSKSVAQSKPVPTSPRIKDSEELLIDKDVNKFKEELFQIQGVEERKKFIKDIGWGVMGEKRGKKYYLFGAKKISGRKYKLYIGNATN